MSTQASTPFRIPESWRESYRPWLTQRYAGWIDAGILEHLDAELERDPDRLLRFPGAEIVRDQRNLTARISIGGRPVWIKRFRPVHAIDRVVYAPKQGKAVYAWNAAVALMERGLRTPRPLIGLRPHGNASGAGGIIAFEEIAGQESLKDKLADYALRSSERDEILHDLGLCLRRFHDLGLRHRDLRQGNILTRRSGDSYTFCFLDLNRLRIQKPLTDIQRLREVERLNLPPQGLELFFRAYMPLRDSREMADMYRRRVGYATRLERLPLGRMLRKAWYYSWELRAYSGSRRP